MDVRRKVDAGVLTLYVEGHVDSKNANEFSREVMAALDDAPGAAVVIDMEKLEYMSSAGLRVLMKVIRRTNGAVKAINVSPDIYDIFEITGFDEMMEVHGR